MNCCIPGEADYLAEPPETSLECDYDKNVTNLYDAIEKGAWDSVLTFLTTKKWSFMSFSADAQSPEAQTRTWVTRFDPNGNVRWSQLPLHAAIIFRAPKNVIEALIDLYPLSVQCTDDQRMLPLHLAVRVGADDSIMNLLICSFPGALQARNTSGKLPYYVEGSDVRKEYTETMQQVVKYTTQRVVSSQKKWSQAKTNNLEGTLEDQSELVKSLEKDKDMLEQKLLRSKREISMWKKKFNDLQRMVGTPVAGAKRGKSKDRKGNDDKHNLLEQSRKLIQLVSTFENENDSDTNSTSTGDSTSDDDSTHYEDVAKQNFKELRQQKGKVQRGKKISDLSVQSSVNLNSIHHLEKPDVCWKEMKTHIYNSGNAVTRYERRETAPEGKDYQDSNICWNELRQTIYNSTKEERDTNSIVSRNKGDAVLKHSSDKLLQMLPKDKRGRATTPKRSMTPVKKSETSKRSATLKEQRQSRMQTKDLKTLRALRLERERRQSEEKEETMIPKEINMMNSSSKGSQRGKSAERPIQLDDSPTRDISLMRKRFPDRNRWTNLTDTKSSMLRAQETYNV